MMLTICVDDYYGEWVVRDTRIWYKTKYWTFQSLRNAENWVEKAQKTAEIEKS